MGAFVSALEKGAGVAEAAAAAGFALPSFYQLRHRDPAFARVWDEAVAKSAGVMLIAPGNGRALQMRRTRRVRFTAARKEAFLAHFAATCDAKAAAETAGVCASTVEKHRRRDAAFREAWDEALQAGYRTLEAALLAEALSARQRYRVAADPDAVRPGFEQALKLLQRFSRPGGEIAPRRRRPEAEHRWDFDKAVAALDKRLRVMGIADSAAEEAEA
jgi:hypothetical protein